MEGEIRGGGETRFTIKAQRLWHELHAGRAWRRRHGLSEPGGHKGIVECFCLNSFCQGCWPPRVISGVFAIAGRLWRANSWADAVALALGYAGGHVVSVGWPAFPPAEATQWLPYFAIGVMFVAVLDTLLRPAGSVRALIWFLLCAGIAAIAPGFEISIRLVTPGRVVVDRVPCRGNACSHGNSRQGRPTGCIDFVSADPYDCRWRNGSRPHVIRQHASGATCVCL